MVHPSGKVQAKKKFPIAFLSRLMLFMELEKSFKLHEVVKVSDWLFSASADPISMMMRAPIRILGVGNSVKRLEKNKLDYGCCVCDEI